jgi:hypothetical protein
MIPPDEYLEAVRGKSHELAFVYLEEKFRNKLDSKLEGTDNSRSFDVCVIEYMNHTKAAARALNLDILDPWDVPSHGQHDLFDLYKDFTGAIDHFKVQVLIDNARSTLRFSVGLDTDEKDKLRNYVAEIKKVIDRSSLVQKKKERLYDLINAFLAEVDRDRTPWDRFADLVIGLAHLGGEVAQELEPARKLIDSIARLLGRSKEFEAATFELPPPAQRRRIPGPPKRLPSPTKRSEMDDEIPF